MSKAIREAARLRSHYSGERFPTAKTGVSRRGDLGLDVCTSQQRQFREVFAHFMFNQPSRRAGINAECTSTVWALSGYTPIFSPRFDELVIVTQTPHNLAGCLVPREQFGSEFGVIIEREETPIDGLPGLRLTHADRSTVWLRHLPTDARMRVTSIHSTTHWYDDAEVRRRESLRHYNWWTPDVPLTGIEVDMLDRVPVYSAGVGAFLRAILTRMEYADAKNNTWANSWFWDPLHRFDGSIALDFKSDIARRLRHTGHAWRLEWAGYPYAGDIARMLTDPTIGLPLATASEVADEQFDVSFQGEILELRPTDHLGWLSRTGDSRRSWVSLLPELRQRV